MAVSRDHNCVRCSPRGRSAKSEIIHLILTNAIVSDPSKNRNRLIHRSDYHKVLCNEAIRLGTEILLDAKVARVNFEESQVVLERGDILEGDVIIGGDGLGTSLRVTLSATSLLCRQGSGRLRETSYLAIHLHHPRQTTWHTVGPSPASSCWL